MAVVPVKALTHAKTRLMVSDEGRRELALAFALDTLTAVLGCPAVSGVLVVTSDPAVVCRLRGSAVRLMPDPGAGLTAAVHDGIRAAAAWQPSTRVVVVPADLPCLRADDVTAVLETTRPHERVFVPDRSGTGTTLLIHPTGPSVRAGYGPGSAARHEALGLRRLQDAPVRARHDVDTVEDLLGAQTIGTGPETAAAAAAALTPRWRPTR